MKSFCIVLLTLLIHPIIYGQLYIRNQRQVVFANQANIRESASINTKSIGTLKQGTEVIICMDGHKVDSINGVVTYWYPVFYNGSSGFVWGTNLATNTFTHSNGNKLLVKNDSKGLAYKVFAGDSLISSGSYPDKPFHQYSHCYLIQPLTAVKNNLYFKLSDSDLMYAFDGIKVIKAGKCDKENINSLHQSSRQQVKDSLGSIINRDKVNLRSLPSRDSKIVGQLSKYTFVEEIERLTKIETINNEDNYWHKIKWDGKVGYVWGSSISTPKQHIHDNDDVNTTYLLCHNALFVLHKGNLVTHIMLRGGVDDDETLHSFGDLGLGSEYDFVAIETMAHGCGEWGGDTYYRWNGKDLKYFCSVGGVGDGGLSEGEEYVFPSEPGGIPGKVVTYSYSSEIIDIMPVDKCEEKYADAIDSYSSTILSYDGDTLIEVPSKYSELKKMTEREFPKYQLIQYKFGDINKDNIEDVVFQMRMMKASKDYDGNYQDAYKTKIGIAFGIGNDSLRLYKVNEHFISSDEARVSISLDGPNILITSYAAFKADQFDNSVYGRKMYQFVYNPTDQKIYWESVSTIFNQGLQKQTFKTKKVLFENAWNIKEYNNEDY